MNKSSQANKERFDLYELAIQRVQECEKFKGEIISFPTIFEKICRSFSIKKALAWELLRILQEDEHIKIVPFKGVIVK